MKKIVLSNSITATFSRKGLPCYRNQADEFRIKVSPKSSDNSYLACELIGSMNEYEAIAKIALMAVHDGMSENAAVIRSALEIKK